MTEYCKISLAPLTGKERHPGYHDNAFRTLFGTTRVNPDLPYTHSNFVQEGAKATKGLSISGVQVKLSLAIQGRELKTVPTGGQFIVKPEPVGYEHAPANEHAAMLVSHFVGIRTASCGLLEFSDGEHVYITRRFDRDNDGSRIPLEDLASAAGLMAREKYNASYETLGKIALELCGKKMAVAMDFIKRVMLAYVIGNDDLHAKNFSLIRDPGSLSHDYKQLSPNYDVLFVSSFEGHDSGHFLALDMFEGDDTEAFGYYGYFTGHDFITLGKSIGLSVRAVERVYNDIASALPAIERIIDRSFMPVTMKHEAAKVVKERLGAVAKGIVTKT